MISHAFGLKLKQRCEQGWVGEGKNCVCISLRKFTTMQFSAKALRRWIKCRRRLLSTLSACSRDVEYSVREMEGTEVVNGRVLLLCDALRDDCCACLLVLASDGGSNDATDAVLLHASSSFNNDRPFRTPASTGRKLCENLNVIFFSESLRGKTKPSRRALCDNSSTGS